MEIARGSYPSGRGGLRRGPKAVILTTDLDVIALECGQINHGAPTIHAHVTDGRPIGERAGVELADRGHIVEQEPDMEPLG